MVMAKGKGHLLRELFRIGAKVGWEIERGDVRVLAFSLRILVDMQPMSND